MILAVSILQLTSILTFPPVLLSILTGKNIIRLFNDIKCGSTPSQQGKIPSSVLACEKFKNYKWQFLIVMIMYICALAFYILVMLFKRRDPKVSKILLIMGIILSFLSVIVLIQGVLSFLTEVQKIERCENQPHRCELSNINKEFKYVWLIFSLTIIFSIIAGILGIINIKKLA